MEIPHRWQGTTIFVARDAESEVDELLDAIESGELISLGEGDGATGGSAVEALPARRSARP